MKVLAVSDMRPCLKDQGKNENKVLVEQILNSAMLKTKILKQKRMSKWIEAKQ